MNKNKSIKQRIKDAVSKLRAPSDKSYKKASAPKRMRRNWKVKDLYNRAVRYIKNSPKRVQEWASYQYHTLPSKPKKVLALSIAFILLFAAFLLAIGGNYYIVGVYVIWDIAASIVAYKKGMKIKNESAKTNKAYNMTREERLQAVKDANEKSAKQHASKHSNGRTSIVDTNESELVDGDLIQMPSY